MLACRVCKVEKPESDFYVSDLKRCKECVKISVKQNREKNKDYYLAFDKQRANLPHRVRARKEYAQTEAGKAARKKAGTAYIKRYPMKYAAHVIFGNAVRDGRIEKQTECSVCGSTEKIEGHHDDYTKPLDVRWLCEKCHKEWHRHNKPIYE